MEPKVHKILESEHKLIISFLQKAFIPYCRDRYKYQIDLDVFIKTASKCFGKDQDSIVDEYIEGLRINGINKVISQSKISRDISQLNVKLKTFCEDKQINPPIQVYNHYLSSNVNREYTDRFCNGDHFS